MTINFFDTTFYDKESAGYSDKRYTRAPESYIQYFFQARLRHVEKLISKNAKDSDGQTLLEDGCADGVVAAALYKKFPHFFSRVVGTDISPGMIEAARKIHSDGVYSFFVKSTMPDDIQADVFLAIGFVSPGIFDDEFSFIKNI
jgi:trans-aconitate methyltransferase